ncbi:ECF transporter S component [Bifidobacterium sp. ESL0763]|uniref:ECF transporter S component n=1 Tax=Bifidobacterium sp. ESL0763 TaxID=2983227 RepID=UPI0023F9C857|nr:ECF transporter S component [Bifidobacterium sp. ESL0763]MDF7663712.1 ECF transporter S component [Bifidobacterium sp. ESL0763]
MSNISNSNPTSSPAFAEALAQPHSLRWRVVDIVVAAAIGVASSLVYWLAAILTAAPWSLIDAIVPGLAGILNGLWLFAGPLASVIVRKPGAAVFAEIVAAVLEALFGNQWGGVETVLIALVQGLLAELVFAAFRYRKWNLGVTMLSGACSGLGCWAYSFVKRLVVMRPTSAYGPVYFATTVVSGVVVAGALMWLLYLAIAKTGALDRFASGHVRNA